ncbi:pirin family protein [Pseudohalioglobus sediminis]|uniref:Pirin family protein n=1 Tax=Pseudohalioglobus sediminis TaxID=2606449 RepID=A0A5B0WPF7_9GAMM|nr:pirin family protein [Pseudohalioglobus sediminis]KAA1188892.1 pirin family protein [Pseudohalioglobus sediminis]
MQLRHIQEIRSAHPSRDGDGVAIQRIAGMQHAGMDPVLMIDELRSEHREDFAGGFPPHPHRGMQTLTYLKHGGIIHQDSEGNRGEIRGGGAQWMSAGRGIIHSEMPTLDTQGLHGFQLWFNLPAAEKGAPPRYRDVPASELATYSAAGIDATAIAGTWHLDNGAVTGPLTELAAYAGLLDIHLAPETTVTLALPAQHNVIGYVYDGSVRVAEREVLPRQLLITGEGDALVLQSGSAGACVLIMQGKPLREPVAHYGPFVMNTIEEIEQTLRDYQAGQFP